VLEILTPAKQLCYNTVKHCCILPAGGAIRMLVALWGRGSRLEVFFTDIFADKSFVESGDPIQIAHLLAASPRNREDCGKSGSIFLTVAGLRFIGITRKSRSY
jgi:hypothetical protein